MTELNGRLLITGVDAEGRSCAVQDGPITPHGFPGFEGIQVSGLYREPAPVLAQGGRAADNLDLAVAPGAVSWMTLDYAPGLELAMHHTDTVDLDLVVAGSVELILDDGAHLLGPGDSAVVTGVDHGWRAGPDGCRLSVVSLGVSPTQGSTAT